MSATPIEKLATLVAQRTARTDRLHEATCALLAQLEPYVEVGASAEVERYLLTRSRVRSNVGYVDGWMFNERRGDGACDLEQPVNGEGYIHGDFYCAWRGPSRDELIAFASRAGRFVESFVKRSEHTVELLQEAQAAIDTAKTLL